jgi:hypothetical protein
MSPAPPTGYTCDADLLSPENLGRAMRAVMMETGGLGSVVPREQ